MSSDPNSSPIMTSSILLSLVEKLSSFASAINSLHVNETWLSVEHSEPNDHYDDTFYTHDNLQKLKNARKIINKLSSCLELEIDRIQEVVIATSFQRGITTIPNEILTRILKYVAYNIEQQSYDTYITMDLASVSRRFRSIIFANWEFWSHVDTINTFCNRKLLERQLVAYGDKPLDLGIHFSPEMQSITDLILKQSHRARSLVLQGDPQNFISTTLSFPLLKKLTVRSWHTSQLFDMWNFSNVTELDAVDIVPPRGSLPSLVKCKLRINTDTIPLSFVASFLSSANQLEILDFQPIGFAVSFEILNHFEMEKLTYLKLHFQFALDRILVLADFMIKLGLAQIEHLEILVYIPDYVNFYSYWLAEFFGHTLRKLVTFNFTLDQTGLGSYSSVYPVDIPLHHIFSMFPSMQQMHIEVDDISVAASLAMLVRGDCPKDLSSIRLRVHRSKSIEDWNSLLSGLERIDVVLSEFIIVESPLQADESDLQRRHDISRLLYAHSFTDIRIS